jgi:hypothetical protein
MRRGGRRQAGAASPPSPSDARARACARSPHLQAARVGVVLVPPRRQPDVSQHAVVAGAAAQDSVKKVCLGGICGIPAEPPRLAVRRDHPRLGDVVGEQAERAPGQAVAAGVRVPADVDVGALAVRHEEALCVELAVELGQAAADADGDEAGVLVIAARGSGGRAARVGGRQGRCPARGPPQLRGRGVAKAPRRARPAAARPCGALPLLERWWQGRACLKAAGRPAPPRPRARGGAACSLDGLCVGLAHVELHVAAKGGRGARVLVPTRADRDGEAVITGVLDGGDDVIVALQLPRGRWIGTGKALARGRPAAV